jgi:hypothetical protein
MNEIGGSEMNPIAQRELGDLEDLALSQEELANEAGEAAAAAERELGGSQEAVDAAYERAHAEVLATAQESLNGAQSEPETPEAAPDTPSVSGTVPKGRVWHGKAPTETVLVLSGKTVSVREGAFHKGERLPFRGELRVVHEGSTDKLDKETMAPVEAVEKFTAVILDFELTDE